MKFLSEGENRLPKKTLSISGFCLLYTLDIRFVGNLCNKGVKSPCHLKNKILFVSLIYSFFQFSYRNWLGSFYQILIDII